jgi:hypothetical protein
MRIFTFSFRFTFLDGHSKFFYHDHMGNCYLYIFDYVEFYHKNQINCFFSNPVSYKYFLISGIKCSLS